MSTSLQTPPQPPQPTRTGRPGSPRAIAAVAAVLVASATTGVLIATAASGPDRPAAVGGGPPASAAPAATPPAAPAGQTGRPPAPTGQAGAPTGPTLPAPAFAYQPLWPFAGPSDAAAWQRAYRTGGQQPWHLDPGATALGFTRGHLGYTGVDRVVRTSVDGREAYVAVGFRAPNGTLLTAADVHLVRLGSGADAPWEVVGTRDTSLTLTTPTYGARVSSPMSAGGRISSADDNVAVQVRTLGQEAPVGRTSSIPDSGQRSAWSVRLEFDAEPGAVLTVAVATGGHVAAVERFAVTGVRVAPPGPPRPATDGDVDGDGRVDRVTFPAPGTLRIRYANGTSDAVAFASGASPYAGVRLLGIVDADRDGRAEVFVRAGSGASTDFATVFRHVDGRLALVTLDGRQAMLGYGGSVRHSHSWACRPPAAPILTWSGESDDGGSYRGTLRSYRFSGATLVQVASRPLTVTDDRPAPRGCGSIRT